MLRALKTKLASFIRAQSEIAINTHMVNLLRELQAVREHVENIARTITSERRDMEETQRMVAIACARIENFIKLQKEHRMSLEQSIAALLPDRVNHNRTI